MPTSSSTIRDAPRRLAAALRRLHWKDLVIALLGLLLVSVSAYAFKDRISGALPGWLRLGQEGEAVSVFDVVLDHQNRAYVDILFDHPLGEGLQGQVLAEEPATFEPALGGSWTWQDTNALRFQPSGGFPVASEYVLTLIPERILGEGQYFEGDTELTIRTSPFLVEKVETFEEPALEGKAQVIVRGSIRFNYAVDPAVLAPRLRIDDPASAEPVPVLLEVDYPTDVFAFRTEPIAKQREERVLRLVVAADLTPQGGNVPLGKEYVQEIPLGSSTRLTVLGVETEPGDRESTVRIRFSSPVSAAVAAQYLKVEPAVSFRPSAERNVLTLVGGFQPGSAYKLTLTTGLPATDEAVLSEDHTAELRLPDLQPSVAFQSQGMFLSASGHRTVAVETVNVPKVRLAIDRVYLNNLFFLFQYGGFFQDEYGYFGDVHSALGDRLKDETLEVGGAKNKKLATRLTLDRWVDVQQPGLYRVSVGQPDDWQAAQRWLLLTDLGVVAKRGRGEILVWVASLRDLGAVEGARVTLVSHQNQTLAEGRTDGSGLFRASDPKLFDKGRPYMVTVEKGNDFTFLLLDSMRIDPTGLDVGGAEPAGEGYTAFLYGERDLYRPGERVKGLAVVRDSRLAPAPAMPVTLRHTDPQGKEIGTQRLTLDDRGLAELSLDLPAYALTGGHSLELLVAETVIGQYRFQVEEFVPDRIKVEIAPPKEKVGPGEELAYEVVGTYLFGPPAGGLPVESRVRLVDANFVPQGFETFSFRNSDRQLEDQEVLTEQATLDEQGRRTFRVTVPSGAPVPSSLEAVITARVQEQGGRGVSALTRVRIHPYPYYLGMRVAGEGYADPGKPVEIEFVAVSPDGKEMPAGALRADFFHDRWNTVLRRVPGGGYRYESSRDPVLLDSRAIPAGQSKGTFRFTPKTWGSYRAVLTDPATQASAEVEVYAAGWGYSPWAIKNPARLELTLDKEEYAPGETAAVQVKAPFPGKLLLAVEREGTYWTEVHSLSGNTATIQVPVRGDFRPNAYVTATLVRAAPDLEPGAVGRAFGAVPIAVDRTANRLTPEITAPEEMRPGRKLEIGVQTVPGAVVTVAAVDEGILQLIAQKTPQPFDFFYRKLALGVESYDTFGLVLPEIEPQGGPAGGGEGEEGLAQYVRTEGIRRVEPVAFWSGPLVADASGKVPVSFDVPEFQGALRIMAVALDGDRFGSAERTTRVKDPLVILPTFPRILSFDERVEVPVTVRNDTARAGKVQIGLAAEGAPVRIDQGAKAVEIARGREATVYFTVQTGKVSGEVRFTATAAGNGERSRSTARVGIRPDLPEIVLEQAGAVERTTTRLPLTDEVTGKVQFRPETLRRELRLGPVPLVQFAGKLHHLLRYPYGCLEQTLSAAFPLVYLGDVARQLDPEVFDPKKGKQDPAVYLQEGLRRMAIMQIPGGGFSLWPGETVVHPWGSVYAAHFLVEARRAGHPVDEQLHRGALDWVASEVRAKSAYGTEELQRVVYGLYVLARAGRADLGTMDFLRQKHFQSLRPESRALLAAAYAAAGNPQAVQTLTADLADVEEVERQTGGNFNSTIRNRALLLAALLDAAPKSPRIPRLVDRLARDLQGTGQWTTQEEGFTLIALGQFFQRQAKLPPYSGTAFVGDKKVAAFGNQMVKLPAIQGTAPVRIEMAKGYKPGAAFYSLLTRGVPTDESFQPASAGLEVEREILTRDGTAADLTAVRQGDLLVMKTRVRSVSGPVLNVAVVNLLPSGLEVENPRLETTETLPWVTDANMDIRYLDLRDDRILVFTHLPANSWVNVYSLVRAVVPGSFRLPPVHAEAMYDPALRATGARGRIEVKVRE